MTKPRLLDLYCCAGGAGVGYSRAGFEVVGVDQADQPNYPFEFIRADATGLTVEFLRQFDAIHASPPCQSFTAYRRKGRGVGDGYLNLIEPTRALLVASGRPWIMENVPGAPLIDPVRLCGSSFGLDVRRHRDFETSFPLLTPPCDHARQAPGRFPGATNRAAMSRATVEVGVWRIPLDQQKAAMGVDWEITLRELSESIPPAFTEYLGRALMRHLEAA